MLRLGSENREEYLAILMIVRESLAAQLAARATGNDCSTTSLVARPFTPRLMRGAASQARVADGAENSPISP